MTTGRLAAAWYVLSALRECLPLFPIYALYMQGSGLTPLQLSTLFAIWSLSALVFEVPSGAIADRLDRRKVLLASRIVQALAFAVWWWQPTFPGFAAGFLLWGLAGSLWSGTAEAWLYECLHERGAAAAFQRIYGTASACATVGIGVALLVGGALATVHMALPFALSIGITLVVGAAVRWLLPASAPALRSAPAAAEAPPLATALAEFRRSARVRHAALAIGVGLVFYGCFEEYVPLLFDAAGLSVTGVGVCYAACYGARAGGMACAGWLGRVLVPAPLAALFAAGLLLGLGTLAGAAGLVAGCVLYFWLNGMAEVWLVDELQQRQGGGARATVMSLARLGMLATGPLLYLGIGGLASAEGWGATAGLVALGTALVALLLGVLRPPRAPAVPPRRAP